MKTFCLLALFYASASALPKQTVDKTQCTSYIEELGVTCPTDRPNEAVTFADPDRCDEYWECFNGCATHMMCSGDLLYDEVTTWCDTAQKVDCGDRECDNDECISNVVTETPLTFDCPADGYYAAEDDCAKFIVCQGGVATEKICPVGDDGRQWLYKEESAWCDYPENVNCGARPVCDSDGQCATEEPDYCAAAGIDCADGSGDGYHEEAPCGKCACYCSGGAVVGEPLCCDGDLVWNPALNVCDWDYNVPACSK